MENQINKKKSIEKDPDYFSAYLNLARHNAFLILSHISDKLKQKKTNTQEGALHKAYAIEVLDNSKAPDITAKSLKMLNEHFPFLKIMFDTDINTTNQNELKKSIEVLPEQYHQKMELVLKLLNNYRNFYTHCIHTPVPLPEGLIHDLDNIFDAAVRVVKKRFELTEEDVQHLSRFERGTDPKTNRLKFVRKNDFKYSFIQNGAISEKGMAFFITLFLEKKYAFEFLKKLYGFKDSRTKMMQATLETYCVYHIYLPKERIESTQNDLSLCLDMFNELKKCPSELFDLLKKEDAEKFRVTPDINNINVDEEINEVPEDGIDDYNVEPILKRYSNRFPYLAMRYIDEKKVFKNLRFHVDLGSYYFKFYPKTTVDGETRDRSLKVHLKSFGRLDDINQARLNEWNKLIRLHKDAEEEEPIEELLPYITDTFPHYHLNNNQIGLKYFQADTDQLLPKLEKEKTKLAQPDFWLSVYELPGLLFYNYLLKLKKGISVEELILKCSKQYKALFKLISEGGTPERIDRTETIKKDGKDKTIILQSVKFEDEQGKSYQIDLNEIPQVLQNYLTDKPLFNRAVLAERKINRMIIETERKLEKIDKELAQIKDRKQNKRGKKRFVEIKSGVLADFLAKDIIRLQPSTDVKGKDKITGLNFQILQSHLAFYGRDYLMLNDIFGQCKLIESAISHPFLDKLNPEKHLDIVSFYKAYLNERKIYLLQCNRNKDYPSYYFLKYNSKKFTTETTAYCKDLAKKLMNTHSLDNHPINLPRGLFNEAVVEWFKKNGNPELKAIANSQRVNVTYLIQKFFEVELDGDTNQSFYDYQRSYEFIDKLNNLGKNPFQLHRNYYSIDQLSTMMDGIKTKIAKLPEPCVDNKFIRPIMQTGLSDYKQNEKILRLYKTQDRVLFLLASEILFQQRPEGLTEGDLKLSNIKPTPESDTDKDLLSTQLLFSLQYKYYDVTPKGEIDHKKYKGEITIFQKELKLKNYGDFIRYTKDRRLNNLFHWIDESKIEMPLLQKELERYEEVRIAVAKIIHNFEKALFEKYRSTFDDIFKANLLKKKNESNGSYVDHNEMLEVFFDKYAKYEQYKELMKSLRNGFSHNQYPLKNIFENEDSIALFKDCPDIELKRENELNIALEIKNYAIATYGRFTDMLNA
jgi:hypothetical protein